MQAAVAVAILVFSCGITLNPDGSGKAVIEVRQSPEAAPGADKAAPTQEEALAASKRILASGRGVDTWADVAVGVTPDGLMTFKGTAYFKNVAEFSVNAKNGEMIPVTWDKDPKGGMLLKLTGPGLPPPQPAQLTPEELDKRVAEIQKGWPKDRAGLAAMAPGVVINLSYKLPGEPTAVAGFKKEADGALLFRLDGTKFLAAADALVADAKALSAAVIARGGEQGASSLFVYVLEEKLLGAKFPFTARVAGEMKPQFDYAAEVKAAQEAYPKMMEKAGLEKALAASATPK